MKGLIFAYLEAQEIAEGAKEVRDECRRYMLKKTHAGVERTQRKPVKKEWTQKAYFRQHTLCWICNETLNPAIASGPEMMVGDHIKPIAQGGSHAAWNIGAAHKHCNEERGTQDRIQQSKERGDTVLEQVQRLGIEEEI